MEIAYLQNSPVDICLGREIFGITAKIDVVRVLVDSNVVDLHCRGELQVLNIDETEISGHAQVDDEILEVKVSGQQRADTNACTIGSCGTGRGPISTTGLAPTAPACKVHANFPSAIQEMYCALSRWSTRIPGVWREH